MERTIVEWQIPNSERTYLRELAHKQATYASLPVMGSSRKARPTGRLH